MDPGISRPLGRDPSSPPPHLASRPILGSDYLCEEPTYGWSAVGTLTHPIMHAVTGESGKLHADEEAIWLKLRKLLPEGDPFCLFFHNSGTM